MLFDFQIVAVILVRKGYCVKMWYSINFRIYFFQCDTGIALLAYMDGITGSPTLGGVVLATISGAAYAVFKVCIIWIYKKKDDLVFLSISCSQVMFRKVIGDPPVPMIAFAFTIIGLINLTLCWPIPLGLYLSGTEVMPLESLFWIDLLIACILMLSKFKKYLIIFVYE